MSANFEKMIAFLKENTDCDLSEVNENTRFVEDLGMNSLELMSMANDAEDSFGITITDDELMEIFTLGDMAAILDKKL